MNVEVEAQPVMALGPVDAARADVDKAHKGLGDRAGEVFHATAACVLELVDTQVEAFVVTQPERTSELGAKGVEKLRSELAAARSKLTADCHRRLKDAFGWTFPQSPPDWIGEADRVPLFNGSVTLPWMVDDTIRALVPAAARLVAANGYEVWPRQPKVQPGTPERPRLPPQLVWERAADGSAKRYLGSYRAPARLIVAMRSYSDARLQYFKRLRALHRLETERRERDARIEDDVAAQEVVQPAAALWSAARERA